MMTALYFDPERDALVCDSPKMEPRRPNLEPSPSPPPFDIPRSQVSPPSSPQNQTGRPLARQKFGPVPAQGDAVLISFLANGRRPDLARLAATEGLPSDDEDDEPPKGVAVVEDSRAQLNSQAQLAALAAGALNLGVKQEPAVPTEPAVDTFVVPLPVERNGFPMANGKETSQSELLESHLSSPPAVNGSHVSPLPAIKTNDELAPIQQPSPKSDKMNGNVTLPSISSTLGALGGLDLKQLAEAATNITTSKTSDNELKMEHPHSFSQSPPGPPPLFSTLHHSSVSGNVSPPMSPNEPFRRELPSPSRRSISTTASPQYTFGHQFRRPSTQVDTTSPYSSTADTPSTSTDQSTPGSIPIDRMSIDGITNPQVGGFQCTYPLCNAAPFQTQYLLNSHANVHSSNRPHYCTVKGCPRSEGGKGFKRKNEMIRHGLVHESPGYVCPFCVGDREHKYPRPDNLQRHVRVHHVDKDKDDPQLREVLSQRPEGPSRGRRRRGGTH